MKMSDTTVRQYQEQLLQAAQITNQILGAMSQDISAISLNIAQMRGDVSTIRTTLSVNVLNALSALNTTNSTIATKATSTDYGVEQLRRIWAPFPEYNLPFTGPQYGNDPFYFHPYHLALLVKEALVGNVIGPNFPPVLEALSNVAGMISDGILLDEDGVSPESVKVTLQRVYDALTAIDAGISASNTHLAAIEDCGCKDDNPPDDRPLFLPETWLTWGKVTFTDVTNRQLDQWHIADDTHGYTYANVLNAPTGDTNLLTNGMERNVNTPPDEAGRFLVSLVPNGENDDVFIAFDAAFNGETVINNISEASQFIPPNVQICINPTAASATVQTGQQAYISQATAGYTKSTGYWLQCASDQLSVNVEVYFRLS
jgi:hypothetical protein